MNLLRVVPVVSLALVLGVAAVAWLTDPPLDYPFQEPPSGAAMRDVDLGIGGETIIGQVLSADGTPLPDASVLTRQGVRTIWAWTDAEGHFVLEGTSRGPCKILVTALGFQSTGFDLKEDVEQPLALTLTREIPDQPVIPGLVLRDLVGTIDLGPGAIGGPRNYELLLHPTTPATETNGGFPRRTTLNPDGGFAIDDLHAGEYRVVLLSPDDAGARGPDLLSPLGGPAVIHVHGAGDGPARLTAQAAFGILRGVVAVPREDGSGPVRGALLRAAPLAQEEPAGDPADRPFFRAARSDTNGRFMLRDLAPGTYRVTLVSGNVRQEQEVTLRPRNQADVVFEIQR